MKPDEQALLAELYRRLRAWYDTDAKSRRGEDFPHARALAREQGMHEKRAMRMFEKWERKDWYEYGCSLMAGWLTDAGMAVGESLCAQGCKAGPHKPQGLDMHSESQLPQAPVSSAIPVFDVSDLQQITWAPDGEFPRTIHELLNLTDRLFIKFVNNLFLRLITQEEGGTEPSREELQAHIGKMISPSGLTHFTWKGKHLLEFVPGGFNEQGGWTQAQVGILQDVRIITPGQS